MKKYIFLLFIFSIYLLFNCTELHAQSMIKVNIAPDHGDWTYKPHEKVKFNVSITRNNIAMKNVVVQYEVSPEKLPPSKQENFVSKEGIFTVDGGTMKEPGFLRCKVTATYDNKEYNGLCTVAFSPETIMPTTNEPQDFMEFWEKAKSDASIIPMDARIHLLPDRCTAKVNVYEVNVQNYQYGARLYGILCIPKAEGKYPAILRVPGAGVYRYNGDITTAERGAKHVTEQESVYPSIYHSAWKGKDNTAGIAIASILDYPHTIKLKFDSKDYELRPSGYIFLIKENGIKKIGRD